MKQSNHFLSFLALVLIAMFACKSEKSQLDLVELDLMSEGMPIVVQAPADAVTETKRLGVFRVTSIKKLPEYYIDVYESDAVTRDQEKIKSRLLSEVQGNPYYQKIISDDPQGFIYETAVDTSFINYGFRYLKLQGDKEYIFQTGLGKKFTLDQVQQMYSAVASTK